MMLDPACTAGRLISLKPARGPDALQGARQLHERAAVLRRLDQVDRADQWQAGQPGQVAARGRDIPGGGVEHRADGRGAQVDLVQQQHGFAQPCPVLADHQGVGAELLAERHRHGVLQLGAAHLQDVVELLGLAGERVLQHLHRVEQVVGREDDRDLDRRRVDVVGRLAQVDVLVRVDDVVVATRVPHDLQRAVRDDLVGVHVRRRAGAALDDVDHELVGQRAAADLLARAGDRVEPFVVQQAEIVVGGCGGLLDRRERRHQVRAVRDGYPRDREVLQRAQGVDTPVGGVRHLPLTDQIVLVPRDNRHRQPPVDEARRRAPRARR
jgi:hypothetical protein